MSESILLGVGTDNGALVLRQGPPHAHWELIVHGLYNRHIACIAQHPDGSIWAGAANGTVYRTRDWENWEPSFEGLRYTSVYSLAIDSRDPDVIYAGTSPATVFRSTDRGRTWQELSAYRKVDGVDKWSFDRPPYLPRVRRFLQHPTQPKLLMSAIQFGGVVMSPDGGESWEARYDGLPRQVYDINVHPGSPARIYASTVIGFFRSDDLGKSWRNLVQGMPYLFSRCLAIDSEDPELVVLGVDRRQDGGGTIFRSENGGLNWQIASSGLSGLDSSSMTCMTSGHGLFFAGTDKGDLFASFDGGKFWPKIRPPLHAIRSLAVLNPRGRA
ncbi:MAG: hypothetical protein HY319_14060 [Armatimonadetes bacterium]|nr:hypothetical protein [Armatimonadota bacterium]